MMQQLLSSLSRGHGKNGQPYADYKTKFLKNIPYSLNELKLGKVSNVDKTIKKFRRLPGTYLTEKGQLLLYTTTHKPIGINREIPVSCKTFSNVYDTIQTVSPEIMEKDINLVKKNSKFHDLSFATASLKTNWFYPKKWHSSAKLLIPSKLENTRFNDRTFQKSTVKENKLISNCSNNGNYHKRIIYLQKYQDHVNLPKLIPIQTQNNALETTPYPYLKVKDRKQSPIKLTTKTLNFDELQFNKHEKNDCDIYWKVNEDNCYEADDELIIQPINNKKMKEIGFLDKVLGRYSVNMSITEVLGSDIIPNTDHKPIILKPVRIGSGKNQKSEELRLNLLKDLYGKLDFLINIKTRLINFGEFLLNQFQRFNEKNHEMRLRLMKEELYDTLKNMKVRNDEIHLRLQKLSEQQLLAKKDTMESTCFRTEWDNMLLDLSLKSKMDNYTLHSRMIKFIESEELNIQEVEFSQLVLEKSSIKYGFIKLRHELIKIEEKKQELEHFIIRLEMKRENVNKIDKEITTFALDYQSMDSVTISTLIKTIKDDIIILWKSKMGEFANNFKVDENQMNNILNKDNTNSFIKEKGDVDIYVEERNSILEDIKFKGHEDMKEAHKKGDSEFSMNEQNNISAKLEYEILRHGQRISSSYIYSYLINWPKEIYQRDYKPAPSTDEEFETEKKRKTCKLNYKTILANNPLLRKRNKTKKINPKKCIH